jgi:hypothetical protein
MEDANINRARIFDDVHSLYEELRRVLLVTNELCGDYQSKPLCESDYIGLRHRHRCDCAQENLGGLFLVKMLSCRLSGYLPAERI